MAEDKRSFVLYADLIHTVRKMPKIKVGELFVTILAYVNDENPEVKDPVVDLVFEPIKRQLKRDLKKWESLKGKRSVAGKKSAELRKQQNPTNSTSVDFVEHSSTQLNTVEHPSTNSTVTVNANANVIYKEPEVKLIDTYFNDLPNSRYFEPMPKDLGTTKEILISLIPQFRKAASVDYPEFKNFCDHFKRWSKIQLEQISQPAVRLKTPFGK